ncbi:MAG: SIR2 family protein [Candidatus Sumerlaeia bacterium]|nr:SIR2 family protein [Candidatus Sumerlaeia bacterium]
MSVASEKIVIFLGAGASKADNAPLQGEVFKAFFENCPDEDFKSQLQQVLVHCFMTKDSKQDPDYPTFEEVLGFLGECLESGRDVVGLGTPITEAWGHVVRAMIEAISLSVTRMSTNCHTQLVDNLTRELGSLRGVVFISTNYDILIDNALASLYRNTPRVCLDYVVDFANFYNGDPWGRPIPRVDSQDFVVELLKPHGSLNWLVCSGCNRIWLTPYEKGAFTQFDRRGSRSCEHCNVDYQPIIVPPTYRKRFANPDLLNVHRVMEDRILAADHIVFCGYSFPDADFHLKNLIKRAQLRRGQSKQFRVSVCNHNPRKTDGEVDAEERRFNRFLGDGVNHTRLSFEEFAAAPSRVLSRSPRTSTAP